MIAYRLYANEFQRAAAVVTASSSDPAFPLAWLRDQLRSKKWRSKLGYNVNAGFNNKLDFKEAGVARVATLTAANYPTPALFAAQVQLSMNAAPGAVNTYVVTYDAATHKFTIARSTGAAALILPTATGANLAVSAYADLGFPYQADMSGLTTYTGTTTSYHSREWIKFDYSRDNSTPYATGGVGLVLDHNLGAYTGNPQTGSLVTVQANTTDAWSAPVLSEPLVHTYSNQSAVAAKLFSAPASEPYWRILIDDVKNPDGFSEIGIAALDTGIPTTVGYSINLSNDPEELSAVDVAIQGAHYQDSRPIRNVWSLEWEEIGDADRTILENWAAATPKGECFFFVFDSTNPSLLYLNTIYCFRASNLRRQYIGPAPSGGYWTLSVTIAEALG